MQALTTNLDALTVIRMYRCNAVLGIVYRLRGRRCATLIGGTRSTMAGRIERLAELARDTDARSALLRDQDRRGQAGARDLPRLADKWGRVDASAERTRARLLDVVAPRLSAFATLVRTKYPSTHRHHEKATEMASALDALAQNMWSYSMYFWGSSLAVRYLGELVNLNMDDADDLWLAWNRQAHRLADAQMGRRGNLLNSRYWR